MEDLIKIAYEFAVRTHRVCGKLYDGGDYTVHIDMVCDNVNKYEHLLHSDADRLTVRTAAPGHDLMEDCGLSYNDVAKVFGVAAADVIFNVTDELGKNRKMKAIKTYPKIASDYKSIFLKLCDRIANSKYSLETGSTMRKAYVREYPFFKYVLYNPGQFDEMWTELESLIYHKEEKS